MAIRLQDLVMKQTLECTTVEQMAEKTVIEQLLNTKPMQLHVWVAERKPTTAAEAGQLADDYIKVKLYCNRRHVPKAQKRVSSATIAGRPPFHMTSIKLVWQLFP